MSAVAAVLIAVLALWALAWRQTFAPVAAPATGAAAQSAHAARA